MPLSRKQVAVLRLRLFASQCRVLAQNLVHGWTTSQERFDAFEAGHVAVTSSGHQPINPHQHPALKEAFDSGALCARDDFLHDAEERYRDSMEKTYAAIDREEMAGVLDECRELGLVTKSAAKLSATQLGRMHKVSTGAIQAKLIELGYIEVKGGNLHFFSELGRNVGGEYRKNHAGASDSDGHMVWPADLALIGIS